MSRPAGGSTRRLAGCFVVAFVVVLNLWLPGGASAAAPSWQTTTRLDATGALLARAAAAVGPTRWLGWLESDLALETSVAAAGGRTIITRELANPLVGAVARVAFVSRSVAFGPGSLSGALARATDPLAGGPSWDSLAAQPGVAVDGSLDPVGRDVVAVAIAPPAAPGEPAVGVASVGESGRVHSVVAWGRYGPATASLAREHRTVARVHTSQPWITVLPPPREDAQVRAAFAVAHAHDESTFMVLDFVTTRAGVRPPLGAVAAAFRHRHDRDTVYLRIGGANRGFPDEHLAPIGEMFIAQARWEHAGLRHPVHATRRESYITGELRRPVRSGLPAAVEVGATAGVTMTLGASDGRTVLRVATDGSGSADGGLRVAGALACAWTSGRFTIALDGDANGAGDHAGGGLSWSQSEWDVGTRLEWDGRVVAEVAVGVAGAWRAARGRSDPRTSLAASIRWRGSAAGYDIAIDGTVALDGIERAADALGALSAQLTVTVAPAPRE